MDRPHPYPLRAAVAAIAAGFAICTAAAEPAEHVSTQAEVASPDVDALTASGITLARSGHHEEAVPRLQRALATLRSKYGVFDLRQQQTLKTLAASLTALNRVPEAQDLMIYRARVAEKAYGEGDLKVVPALCDLGDWFAEVGKALRLA